MKAPDSQTTPVDRWHQPKTEPPLYIRLFFRKHLTDLVRAIGYESLDPDEATRRIRPLIAAYGEADILAACDELLEHSADGSAWRLTTPVRELAVGILGRPQAAAAVAVPTEPAAAIDTSVASPAQADADEQRQDPKTTKNRAPRRRKTKENTEEKS